MKHFTVASYFRLATYRSLQGIDSSIIHHHASYGRFIFVGWQPTGICIIIGLMVVSYLRALHGIDSSIICIAMRLMVVSHLQGIDSSIICIITGPYGSFIFVGWQPTGPYRVLIAASFE